VQSLAHSLAKILAIRGVTYKWIDEDKYGSQTQIGVIAQEIEKIVPEVVTTDRIDNQAAYRRISTSAPEATAALAFDSNF